MKDSGIKKNPLSVLLTEKGGGEDRVIKKSTRSLREGSRKKDRPEVRQP